MEPANSRKSRPEIDDLKRLHAIGPKAERLLREAGITTYADVAASEPQQLNEVLRRIRSMTIDRIEAIREERPSSQGSPMRQVSPLVARSEKAEVIASRLEFGVQPVDQVVALTLAALLDDDRLAGRWSSHGLESSGPRRTHRQVCRTRLGGLSGSIDVAGMGFPRRFAWGGQPWPWPPW